MPIASHYVPQAEREEAQEEDEELYADEACLIKVQQSPGFLCHIEASARFSVPPKTLWEQAIVHPDNAAIFRHMDRCTYRKVISSPNSDNPDAVRKVEVAHTASWRFLAFSGEFTTRLLVEEDSKNYIMRFTLLPNNSIISKFQGVWQVKPMAGHPDQSLSILGQDIALSVWMPPPIDRLMKSISSRQVRRIFEDLKQEVHRINDGCPTLAPYAEVKDKSIGGG